MASSSTPAKKAISALKGADISSHEVALIVVAALEKRERFDPEDIALCTSVLFDRLRIPPLRDTIYVDQASGVLHLNGEPVKDDETQERVIEAAKSAEANRAARMVRDLVSQKVEYAAAIMARNATTPYDLVFSKAAIWVVQQIDEVYAGLTKIANIGEV